MVTDFMKEATKSFCIPLDIDFECHKEGSVNLNTSTANSSSHPKLSLPSTTTTTSSSSQPLPPLPLPPVPSIYYVPSYEQEDGTMDSGEAKFLLTSTCTFCYKRRNCIPRIPYNNDLYIIQQSKPISLHRLNDALYCNLIADLQSTLKYRSGWFLLFWLPFCMCAALSSLVLVFRTRSDENDDNGEYTGDDTNITNDYKSSWPTISIIVIVSFIIGKILYRIKLRNIEDELHIRVQYEWLPVFEQHGFAINYVIDDPGPFYTRKETYIHIYRINTVSMNRRSNGKSLTDSITFRRSNSLLSPDVVRSAATGTAPTVSIISEGTVTSQRKQVKTVVGYADEAKYLVFYPMELARRNVDARQIGYSYLSSSSSSDSTCHCKNKYYCSIGCVDRNNDALDNDDQSQMSVYYYIKPPLLRDLPDSEEGVLLLHEFLYDIEIMTSPSYTVRMILFVILFISFILLCVYAMARHDAYGSTNNHAVADSYQDNVDGSFALFCFLLLVYILDRFLRLYTSVYCMCYDVANVVEKVWLPQFQLYGYNVKYCVNQPHWYSFREDYIHIYKTNEASG